MTALVQYGRRVSLIVTSRTTKAPELATKTGNAMELGEMHFTFSTSQNDEEQPSNCSIRIYTLSDETVKRIRGEFDYVVLQAGYVNGNFGIIFQGNIKQYRIGKENATDKYLDILAADGDEAYNFGVVNASVAAGTSRLEQAKMAIKAMGLEEGYNPRTEFTGLENLRGKVLFGMGRNVLRNIADSNNATWSIQDGLVQIIPLDSYLPNEAVLVNSATGMIGYPELTDQGVKVRMLINPRLRVGGAIKIDNRTLNKLVQQNSNDPSIYNKYAGVQANAAESADGLYRCYVIEYKGDTRGNDWYADIIGLAVNSVSKKIEP